MILMRIAFLFLLLGCGNPVGPTVNNFDMTLSYLVPREVRAELVLAPDGRYRLSAEELVSYGTYIDDHGVERCGPVGCRGVWESLTYERGSYVVDLEGSTLSLGKTTVAFFRPHVSMIWDFGRLGLLELTRGQGQN